MESDGGTGYGYAVIRDGAETSDEPLHEDPFERLEQAHDFAVEWLADAAKASDRLAVVRVYHGERRRMDTVAIVDPSAADVQTAIENVRRRG